MTEQIVEVTLDRFRHIADIKERVELYWAAVKAIHDAGNLSRLVISDVDLTGEGKPSLIRIRGSARFSYLAHEVVYRGRHGQITLKSSPCAILRGVKKGELNLMVAGDGGRQSDATLLMQARYVLRNLHFAHPDAGYGKMAEAVDRAAMKEETSQ